MAHWALKYVMVTIIDNQWLDYDPFPVYDFMALCRKAQTTVQNVPNVHCTYW